jgi:hypothetical protein
MKNRFALLPVLMLVLLVETGTAVIHGQTPHASRT